MRKFFCFLACIVLFSTTFFSIASADSLRVSGFDKKTITPEVNERIKIVQAQWYVDWQTAYPKITLTIDKEVSYKSTSALVKALQGKSMKSDVLRLSSSTVNWPEVMATGTLMDLSVDPHLSELVAQMHPVYSSAVSYDGHIYGIPTDVEFLPFLSYDPKAFELAGYSTEDVPTSFSALLDFLESWAIRCRTNPVPDVCVTNTFVETKFNENSYTQFLTELLVEQYVVQCLGQGKGINFNTPEFISILERIPAVGAMLFETDKPLESNYSLINDTSLVSHIPYFIPTRLNDSDPICITVNMQAMCIPQVSKNQEAALAFMHVYMDCIHGRTYDYTALMLADADAMLANGLLFANATGEIPNYGYGTVAYVEQLIASQEAIAADSSKSETERELARENLARYEAIHWLERAEREDWQLTADELHTYQNLTQYIGVCQGSINIIGTKTTRNLESQYAAGKITAQQFVERMEVQNK